MLARVIVFPQKDVHYARAMAKPRIEKRGGIIISVLKDNSRLQADNAILRGRLKAYEMRYGVL